MLLKSREHARVATNGGTPGTHSGAGRKHHLRAIYFAKPPFIQVGEVEPTLERDLLRLLLRRGFAVELCGGEATGAGGERTARREGAAGKGAGAAGVLDVRSSGATVPSNSKGMTMSSPMGEDGGRKNNVNARG